MTSLFIVPTPIGNLNDITCRALDVLKTVEFIIAEDTRVTRRLLDHYTIDKPLFSHHKFNERSTLKRFIDSMLAGKVIALVSDAGTPSVSDPGFMLVREAISNGLTVECLPGPTALIPALVNSGLPSDRFCFEGFLPLKKGRQTRLKELASELRTMIFYESPHRLVKTLTDLAEYLGGERNASVSRELTKLYEETKRDTLFALAHYFAKGNVKGEIVIVVEGKK